MKTSSEGEWTTETALAHLQSVLVVPKDQWNDFSKFHYRNVESICAAAKKAMKDAGIEGSIVFADEVVLVGDLHYLKSLVYFGVVGLEEPVSTSAYARIPVSKKGMDDCQILGAASSYARKYAICGLLAIDDGKSDPDSHDNREDQKKPLRKIPPPKSEEPLTESAIQRNYTGWLNSINATESVHVLDGLLKDNKDLIVKDLGGEGSPFLADLRSDIQTKKRSLAGIQA